MRESEVWAPVNLPQYDFVLVIDPDLEIVARHEPKPVTDRLRNDDATVFGEPYDHGPILPSQVLRSSGRLDSGDTLCHFLAVKKYSIRELHQSTGAIVRESADEPVLITDRNRPIAVIRPISEGEVPGQGLPDGHWESVDRPVIEADSTEAVSADRER